MAFIKLLVLAIISIVMLVLAGLANDWLRNRLGIKTPPPALPTLEQLLPRLMPTYISVGYALTRCVNSSRTCGLMVTQCPEQNHVPLKERVIRASNNIMFEYEFQRDIVGHVKINGVLSPNYNPIPAQKIKSILNRSIEGHCNWNGCVTVMIVYAKDVGDGRVRLAVAEKPVIF